MLKHQSNYGSIDKRYIESNWRFKVIDTDLSVIYGRTKKKCFITFFNPDVEILALDLIKKYKLNASYKYFMEDLKIGVVLTEVYVDGVLDDFYETRPFSISNYNVARCFE